MRGAGRGYRSFLTASVCLAVLLTAGGVLDAEPERPCAECGRSVRGNHVEVEGQYYHPQHFLCARCRELIAGSFRISGRKAYHTECYLRWIAPRCDHCGKILEGRYITTFWGDSFHESHEDDSDRCVYCRRFTSPALTRGGETYADGRHVCGLCRESVAKGASESIALAGEVARRLREHGMDVDLERVRIHLIDRNRLEEMAGDSDRIWGHTVIDLSGRLPAEVHILAGSPRMVALASLAHEFAHVWRSQRTVQPIDQAFEEGSCNFAAYLLLREFDGGMAAYLIDAMMKDTDHEYGEGFRRVRSFAEDAGIDVWLDRFSRERRLPPGY